jgi:hypothetical protein
MPIYNSHCPIAAQRISYSSCCLFRAALKNPAVGLVLFRIADQLETKPKRPKGRALSIQPHCISRPKQRKESHFFLKKIKRFTVATLRAFFLKKFKRCASSPSKFTSNFLERKYATILSSQKLPQILATDQVRRWFTTHKYGNGYDSAQPLDDDDDHLRTPEKVRQLVHKVW